MTQATADLYDANEGHVHVLEIQMRSYGLRKRFHGPVSTLKVHEDNPLVKAALKEAGHGRVLVVDGGGSQRYALIGDKLAGFAIQNGWAGVIVFGCIRDSAIIDTMDVGIRALGSTPARSTKHGFGERDKSIRFGGITFEPDHFVYVDEDGILVSRNAL